MFRDSTFMFLCYFYSTCLFSSFFLRPVILIPVSKVYYWLLSPYLWLKKYTHTQIKNTHTHQRWVRSSSDELSHKMSDLSFCLWFIFFSMILFSSIQVAMNWMTFSCGCVMFHCAYIQLLNPLICCWTFGLFPYPGFCTKSCNERYVWNESFWISVSVSWG